MASDAAPRGPRIPAKRGHARPGLRGRAGLTVVGLFILLAFTLPAAQPQSPPPPAEAFNEQDLMISARDGVRLHTKIFTPKNQAGPLPIIMRRTPYGIDGAAGAFTRYFKALADEGYIFVFQDIRGKFGSEGDVRDAAAGPSAGRHHEPRRRHRHLRHHRVAARRTSPATTAGSACSVCRTTAGPPSWRALEPHPALKAISPQASPADMWLGDDFHHNGAFRLSYGFEYATMMETGQATCSNSLSIATTRSTGTCALGPLANVNAQLPAREDSHLERLRRASRLRRVLEAPDDGAAPAGREGADAERGGLVGPGGLLRAGPHLRGARAARHGGHELPGRRARGITAAGRGTGDALGADHLRQRHRRRTSATRCRRRSSPTSSRTRARASFPEALTFEAGSEPVAAVGRVAAEAGHPDGRLRFGDLELLIARGRASGP